MSFPQFNASVFSTVSWVILYSVPVLFVAHLLPTKQYVWPKLWVTCSEEGGWSSYLKISWSIMVPYQQDAFQCSYWQWVSILPLLLYSNCEIYELAKSNILYFFTPVIMSLVVRMSHLRVFFSGVIPPEVKDVETGMKLAVVGAQVVFSVIRFWEWRSTQFSL